MRAIVMAFRFLNLFLFHFGCGEKVINQVALKVLDSQERYHSAYNKPYSARPGPKVIQEWTEAITFSGCDSLVMA